MTVPDRCWRCCNLRVVVVHRPRVGFAPASARLRFGSQLLPRDLGTTGATVEASPNGAYRTPRSALRCVFEDAQYSDLTELGSCSWGGPISDRGGARSLANADRRSVDPGSDSGVPLPGRLGVRPSSALVGRDVEQEMIGAAFARVAAGAGREIIIVCGEAGVGKTTVLAAAARQAFDAGACVLFGHGEADLTAPYQLFVEPLGHVVAHASQAALVEHVAWRGAELVPLVPGVVSSAASPVGDADE